jgi:heme-degrading monooxygenase HmoA
MLREQIHHRGRTSNMFARIGTWRGTPEELERWIRRSRDEVLPGVREQLGIAAAYCFLDREDGKGLTITIWDSEEQMRASEQFRAGTQGGTSAASGASVTTDRYEVVASL